MKKKLSIQEFAKKLGVSVATVSRALNDETRDKVAPKTLALVEAGVLKYGYTPNLSARNLRHSSYRSLGIVFVHHAGLLSSEYYSHLLSGFSDGCLEKNYRVKMLLLQPEKGPWDLYDFKNGEGIDGLVITYWRSLFSDKNVFKNMDIPSIVINNVEQSVQADFIGSDHSQGGKLIAEHLYDKGHRKIAIVGGRKGAIDSQDKLEAFYKSLARKGISRKSIPFYDVEFSEEKTRERADEILSTPGITAIFCMDDSQAIALLEHMKINKMKKNISIIGYGNERRGLLTEPTLTTVKAPVYELGYQAALDLVETLKKKKKSKPSEIKQFPVELIERQSVYSE